LIVGSFLVFVAVLLHLVNISGTKVAYASSAACQTTTTVQQSCIVTDYLVPAINFLSAGVGVVVIAMIIIGAIQYTTSGGNPQGEADARKKIFNALLALITFIFIYAFLNFVIPGGVIPI
ncbi:MAG TPA: hypothetical protein VNZ45_10630, partial [Bacteroidia bacterium]|nr:hypothetical protein [Bacteroidia bacterium]